MSSEAPDPLDILVAMIYTAAALVAIVVLIVVIRSW